MKKMDWNRAEKHLYEMKRGYEAIGLAGSFGLAFIYPLVARFEAGERGKELYKEIMELE